MTKSIDIKNLSSLECLVLHGEIIEELIKRKVLRTRNNPAGDYAEYLVECYLGVALEDASNKGYDVKDKKGKKYEIKGCRNKQKQLGIIRNLEDKSFDFLIGIIFDSDYSVLEVYKIPHRCIQPYASWSEYKNGYIVYLKGDILRDESVLDITNEISNKQDELEFNVKQEKFKNKQLSNSGNATIMGKNNNQIKSQRDMMRELVQQYGHDKEKIIREYALAERQGKVERKRNLSGENSEDYALKLWSDGMSKGWFKD